MRIDFIEIQNFRKLKSCRIDLSEKTSVFVGANNSGKTSAMDALRLFLVKKKLIRTTDFTLSNWLEINEIGRNWTKDDDLENKSISIFDLQKYLPSVDVWIQVEEDEIHYVKHLLPTLDWSGGALGVRFRFEPKSTEDLFKEYRASYKKARETTEKAGSDLKLWPSSLREFLDRQITKHFEVKAYILDPKKCNDPVDGVAMAQELALESIDLKGDPLKGLVKIDIINAQRGFSDVNYSAGDSSSEDDVNSSSRGNLSTQLRKYYSLHINPSDSPDESDIDALEAIEKAQSSFDSKIKEGFGKALKELEGLGYPGFNDPTITISSKVDPVDSLNHASAVQFDVIKNNDDEESTLKLPEKYNGLGYQNLISMVFKLMRFRDEWMRVGKASEKISVDKESFFIEPLHLVLVEEPEAHLHAQVQQVFIRKAYNVLRKNEKLGEKNIFTTQLIVSTHSSHVAHETDFANLRYFKRRPAKEVGKVPFSTVVNLSSTFGDKNNETTKFATRYLKSTHCDLFFADAVVLVEGPAERMLVPHFIKDSFEKLTESYISILEVGGSHAHRLRPLIENLGLISLVITDLDSTDPAKKGKAVHPEAGKGYKSGNTTLSKWVPGKSDLDELLNLNSIDKEDNQYPVRVAYQTPIATDHKGNKCNICPYTFEDALVFNNISIFENLTGSGLIKKIKEAFDSNSDVKLIGNQIFEDLKKAKKAAFALDLLYLEDPSKLLVPEYISEGLNWLQDKLEEGSKDFDIKPKIKSKGTKKKATKKP